VIPDPESPARMNADISTSAGRSASIERRVVELLLRMTLDEKIGQMCQVDASHPQAAERLGEDLREGRIGSVINQVDREVVDELQRIAREESRLGIPLLAGRDVIHGFATVLPIPLGQAATWNPELVCEGGRAAAAEATACGVNWTFAPMIDIARDPRWGRIAESFGEDPHLASRLGVAMIEGFQGPDLAAPGSMAACAKHFAGYGAVESGRDYATTNVPENELRNVYLRPFRAAVDAGVASLMTSFSDLDGVPATANAFLLREILRAEWRFDGFVVSDWDAVRQLAVHGLTGADRDSAREAVNAGVDMEMAGDAYRNHLAALVAEGRVGLDTIDEAVANVLRIKFRLGLLGDGDAFPRRDPRPMDREALLRVAERLALQSVVLLKNDDATLPLSTSQIGSLAVIGPLADAPYEQLGTWIFDGEPGQSITGLAGIRRLVGDDVDVRHHRALTTSRSRSTEAFPEAADLARRADAVVLFLGEESILSGEAHSRADIRLPGAQADLVRLVRRAGRPVIAVVMAGRPLVLTDIVDEVDAILFAWHPGTMAGAAIADLLFGVESPSGKLPATFPRMVGQVPIYYAQKNTGKPPTPETIVHIDDIEAEAPQTSLGMTAFHLDAGYRPLFPFGHGLSYAEFAYHNLTLSGETLSAGKALTIGVDVTNLATTAGEEVVQLYVRDLVGNVTRPVRELKDFRRVRIEPGETVRVEFELRPEALAFYGRHNTLMTEPGEFHLWVGGSSEAELRAEFRVVAAD
jgi:beta-glucosidase